MDNREILLQLKNSSDPTIKREFAELLFNSGNIGEEGIDAYISCLKEEDMGLKDICSRFLKMAPAPYKLIVAMKVAPLIESEVLEQRNLAGEILQSLGNISIEALIPYIHAENADTAKFACDLIGLVADSSSVDEVAYLLDSPDENLRSSAIEAIGQILLGKGSDHDTLGEKFVNEFARMFIQEEDLRLLIIDSIGKIGGKKAQNFLMVILDEDPDMFTRISAIDALTLAGADKEICERLIAELGSTPLEMQKVLLKAIFGIATRFDYDIKLPEKYRYLAIEALLDDDEEIRLSGLIALGDEYFEQDIEALTFAILKFDERILKGIIKNIMQNSSSEIVASLFAKIVSHTIGVDAISIGLNFLGMLPGIWQDARIENKSALMNSIIEMIAQNLKSRGIGIIEMLIDLDAELLYEAISSRINVAGIEEINDIIEVLELADISRLNPIIEEAGKARKMLVLSV